MHPLFRLLAMRPQAVAEHAGAYAELAAAEFDVAATAWRRSLLLAAAGLCAATVTAVLAGVALMLWAVLPVWPPQAAAWLALAIAVPLGATLAAVVALRRPAPAPAFAELRQQCRIDLDWLRQERP